MLGSSLTAQQPIVDSPLVPRPAEFSVLQFQPTTNPQPAKPASTGKRARTPLTLPDARSDAGESIDQLVTKLVLENIPHHYEETKDWGKQDERWDGIEFRREGLKIETKRRKKTVNHGTWKKYSAQLRNPAEEFTVQVKNMHETATEKLGFDVHFQAHVDLHGRQSKWARGVQLYSIGITGHSIVRLVVSMELEVKTGGNGFPPDLVFVPRATRAEIVLDDFRIDRIGKIGGEIAQQVSRGIRSKLDEKIAEKEKKLLEKINRQLAEKQDQMRISVADAIQSKWTLPARAFLPKSVDAALDQ